MHSGSPRTWLRTEACQHHTNAHALQQVVVGRCHARDQGGVDVHGLLRVVHDSWQCFQRSSWVVAVMQGAGSD